MEMEKQHIIKTGGYVAEKEAVCAGANISKNGVVYFPFEEEEEALGWIEDVTSEWWDDEAI